MSAGAEAPKLDIPINPEFASLPRSPNNHLSQLSLTPASIAILTCLPPGRMRLRYLSSCFSNSSMQGIDTTLVPIPSLCNFSLAVSASETSDPEAINITCRFPSASAKIYAPFEDKFADVYFVLNVGSPCLVSASTEGVFFERKAISQASAVSTLSAGRITKVLGVERLIAKCSTGWWVGPSSPKPMLSCVITNIVGIFINAARRIEGRA